MTTRFRVWDGEEVHEPSHNYLLTGTGTLFKYDRSGELSPRLTEEFMFATGLTDADGNEIWEEDIVDWADGRGVVYWHDDKARYLHAFAEKIDGDFNGSHRPPKALWDKVRVIGNRYEDPNLLEGSTA
jgi:hypothetical protein